MIYPSLRFSAYVPDTVKVFPFESVCSSDAFLITCSIGAANHEEMIVPRTSEESGI